MSRQVSRGQDFLSGSAVLPATEDSPIQAHNVPVSPDNTSCLCWLQPSQGYTIFHSSKQWPVCLHPPYDTSISSNTLVFQYLPKPLEPGPRRSPSPSPPGGPLSGGNVLLCSRP
ncbi:hypothetical protein EYF80_015485 [Liparis tanakae]|uniref:Uncharacterized protein n=1 Tax=Liparis tanakae TaxID=230148 RepID=A0A4Z2IA17_9TELE|nr:hypothetical protein EYF80_015485 [Liparis tanakae]